MFYKVRSSRVFWVTFLVEFLLRNETGSVSALEHWATACQGHLTLTLCPGVPSACEHFCKQSGAQFRVHHPPEVIPNAQYEQDLAKLVILRLTRFSKAYLTGFEPSAITSSSDS